MAEVVLETAHGGKVGSLPVFGVTDASYWVWHVGAGFGRVVSFLCCFGVVLWLQGWFPLARLHWCVLVLAVVSFPASSGVSSSIVGVWFAWGLLLVVQLAVGFVHKCKESCRKILCSGREKMCVCDSALICWRSTSPA